MTERDRVGIVNRFLIPLVSIFMFFRVMVMVIPALPNGIDHTQTLVMILIVLVCIQSILDAIYHLEATPVIDLIYDAIERRKNRKRDEP
jgi:hypothetical protein